MDICIRNFAQFTGCSIGEAIKCATYNPAKYVSFRLIYLTPPLSLLLPFLYALNSELYPSVLHAIHLFSL